MDSLKTLFDKKQYKLIISLTENSNDENGLFYRLSAFVSLGEYKKALALIETHRDVFEKNMIALLKLHFEILIQLNEFDKAYQEIEYYQSRPYVSQEVEEYLVILPKLVRNAEKQNGLNKSITSDEIINIFLTSKDNYDVLLALDKIKTMDKKMFIPSLINVCQSNERLHPYVRTYALLVLVDLKYDQCFAFKKNTRTYQVTPKDLYTPYTGDQYNDFIKRLANMVRNPSLSNVALNMLNEYIMYSYPENIFKKNNDLLLASSIALADSYFSTNEDISYICQELHLELDSVMQEKKTMEQKLLSIVPLKM